ncbi:MAG: 4Fe-4S dicluster domain-containing protein [Candidatus Dormibacteria bacterium]
MLYIDPNECIDCGACVDPCPVAAIYAEEDLPADQHAYAEVNLLYFKDRDAARKQVDDLHRRSGSTAKPVATVPSQSPPESPEVQSAAATAMNVSG